MTRWHVMNEGSTSVIKCEAILKKRVLRGINSFECKWAIPDLMLNDPTVVLITTEPQDLFVKHKSYTGLVKEFEASKAKKKGIIFMNIF